MSPPLRFDQLDQTGQARIRANLAKMEAQHAPDADIESYLRDVEHLSPAGPVAPPQTAPSGQANDIHAQYRSGALAKRMAAENAKDVAASQPGLLEKVAAHGANLAQGIPGMQAVEAGVGAAASRLPGMGKPLSYRESYNALEDATNRIPTALRVGERIAGGLPLASVLPGSPAVSGALLGGADVALSGDPNKTLGQRAVQAPIAAGVGALLGKTLDLGTTAIKSKLAPNPQANLVERSVARKQAAAPLYRQFRQLGDLGNTPELGALIGDQNQPALPVIQRAIETVKGESPTLSKLPDTDARVLDAVYKRIGKKSFTSQQGFETGEARNDLLSAIEDAAASKGGFYKAPVGVFREHSQGMEAVQRGRDALANALSRGGGGEKAALNRSPAALQQWLAANPEQSKAAAEGALGQLGKKDLVKFGRVLGTPLIPYPTAALRHGTQLVNQINPENTQEALKALLAVNSPFANP